MSKGFVFGCTFYSKVLKNNERIEYEKSPITIINVNQIAMIDKDNCVIIMSDGTRLYPDSMTLDKILDITQR